MPFFDPDLDKKPDTEAKKEIDRVMGNANKELLTNLLDPRNAAEAAAQTANGWIKGLTANYIDPDKARTPIEKFLATATRYGAPISGQINLISDLTGKGGTLKKEIDEAKIGQMFGEMSGAVAPISGVAKAVAYPVKGAKFLTKAGWTKRVIGGKTVIEPTRRLTTVGKLVDASVTGGVYGFGRKPEGEDTIEKRSFNALVDMGLFPVFTGGFIAGAGLLNSISAKGAARVMSRGKSYYPETDVSTRLLAEKALPNRTVTLNGMSKTEYISGLQKLETLPKTKQKAAVGQVFGEKVTESVVLNDLKAREALPPTMRDTPGGEPGSFYEYLTGEKPKTSAFTENPFEVEPRIKDIEPKTTGEEYQLALAKYKDLGPRGPTDQAVQLQNELAAFARTDIYNVKQLKGQHHVLAGREAVRRQLGEHEVRRNRALRFTADSRKQYKSTNARTDMTVYAEKTGNFIRGPKDTHADVSKRLDLYPGAKETVAKGLRYKDAMREIIKRSHYADDIGFRENHILHLWNTDRPTARRIAQKWSKRAIFANQNEYATFEEGVRKEGLKPVTTDFFDLLDIYTNSGSRVLTVSRMMEDLAKLSDGTAKGRILYAPRAKRYHSQPPDSEEPLQEITKPSLEKYNKIQRERAAAALKSGTHVRVNYPAFKDAVVHRDVAPFIEMINARPYDNALVRGYEAVNAFAKGARFLTSFFHHLAITENAVGMWGIKGLNPIALTRAGKKSLENQLMTDIKLMSGLDLGPIGDAQVDTILRSLDAIDRGVARLLAPKHLSSKFPKLTGAEPIRTGIKGIRKAKQLWDASLWQYYHTPLKSFAFDTLYLNAIKHNPNVNRQLLGREIAMGINDIFGGQNWAQTFVHPKITQLAQMAILSPDWNYSTARQAIRSLTGTFMKMDRAVLKAKGYDVPPLNAKETEVNEIMKKNARLFWARATVAMVGSTAALNKFFTGYMKGGRTPNEIWSRGHWPWENPPGTQTTFQLPFTDEEGNAQYAKVGKQFREMFALALNPGKAFASKSSPTLQFLFEQATGMDLSEVLRDAKPPVPKFPGSNMLKELSGQRPMGVSPRRFELPFAGERGQSMSFSERLKSRGESALEKVTPFSFSGNNVGLMISKRKLSPRQFQNILEEAIIQNDWAQISNLEIAAGRNKFTPDEFDEMFGRAEKNVEKMKARKFSRMLDKNLNSRQKYFKELYDY